MIFFSGYFSVNDKLYCETHARAAKASENVSQRIPMNTQQQQQQQPIQPAAAPRQQQQQPATQQVIHYENKITKLV